MKPYAARVFKCPQDPGSYVSGDSLPQPDGPDGNIAELTSKPLEKRKWNHVQGEERLAVSSC